MGVPDSESVNNPETFADRFWAKAAKGDGCWEWQGGHDSRGYGMIRVNGKHQRAHRVAWTLVHGPVPDGRFVCHKCDNPPCVRPDHLYAGTPTDNSRDRIRTTYPHRGHIQAHGDGAWRIYAEAGADPITGKRKKVTRVIRGSRRDAEKALAALVAAADSGQHAGTTARTFGHAIDAYLDAKQVEFEATTFDTYRAYATYLDPLRDQSVAKVTVDQLERLYLTLRRSGRKRDGVPMSVSAVTSVHKISRGALDYAWRRKWVAENVAANARVPGGPARQPSPAPTAAVARLLTEAAAEHPALPAYLRVSIAVGARRSEVHGLRWSGIDFTRRRILLRDVIVRADGQWLVKPRLKTGAARVVTVDEGTIDVLRRLQATAMDYALACGTTLAADAFVFSDHPAGEVPWNPRTSARRFTRVCERVGLAPTTRLHDLRHLAATHLLAEGLPVPAVSSRLGHTRASTTLDIYSAALPQSDETAARVMGELLDG